MRWYWNGSHGLFRWVMRCCREPLRAGGQVSLGSSYKYLGECCCNSKIISDGCSQYDITMPTGLFRSWRSEPSCDNNPDVWFLKGDTLLTTGSHALIAIRTSMARRALLNESKYRRDKPLWRMRTDENRWEPQTSKSGTQKLSKIQKDHSKIQKIHVSLSSFLLFLFLLCLSAVRTLRRAQAIKNTSST